MRDHFPTNTKTPFAVRALKIGLLAAAVAATVGCAQLSQTMGQQGPSAQTKLESRSGSQVQGQAKFVQQGKMVVMQAEISGLAPGKEHGFHMHDKGDCSAADGSSAGGHFNPTGQAHGHRTGVHHLGDLPALKADADGKASVRVELDDVSVTAGPGQIVGRALVIHRDADDYKTQPTGNSGARVACGVIQAQ